MVLIEAISTVQYTGWENSFSGYCIAVIDIDCHGSSSTRNSGIVVDVPMLDEDTELIVTGDTVTNLCTMGLDLGERPQKETECEVEIHTSIAWLHEVGKTSESIIC